MAKGAILIGYGSLPTKADIDDALRSGWIKNCTTVTATSFPLGTQPSQELHFSTYLLTENEKGWDDPGGLQAMKITTKDGRIIYSVYPLNSDKPKLTDKEAMERVLKYHQAAEKPEKKWWQFWK